MFQFCLGLCKDCYLQVKHKQQLGLSHESCMGHENCLSLISWGPDNPTITSMAYFLKSRHSYALWCEIAQLFYRQRNLYINKNSRKVIFIPIPSTGGNYHSYYFAKAASQVFNLPHVSPLYSTTKTEQKSKNRLERHKTQFLVREEFTDLLKQIDMVILLDDVITTGATYKAVVKALQAHIGSQTKIMLLSALSRDKLYRC